MRVLITNLRGKDKPCIQKSGICLLCFSTSGSTLLSSPVSEEVGTDLSAGFFSLSQLSR